MLSVHTTLVEFKNEKSPVISVILDLCLSKLGQRNHTIIIFEKNPFFSSSRKRTRSQRFQNPPF